MQTVIIKQNEHGGFDVAATDGEAIRVIVAENDLTGEPNLRIDNTDCLAWDIVADNDPKQVNEILNSYIKENLMKRITSIGWLNCGDGSINLTPCLDGNSHATFVNISSVEFRAVRDSKDKMKNLAAEKLGLK